MELEDGQDLLFTCGIGLKDELGLLQGYKFISDLVEHRQSHLGSVDFLSYKFCQHFCYISHALVLYCHPAGSSCCTLSVQLIDL